jgi:hypothetical protein
MAIPHRTEQHQDGRDRSDAEPWRDGSQDGQGRNRDDQGQAFHRDALVRDRQRDGRAPDSAEDGAEELFEAGFERASQAALRDDQRRDHSPKALSQVESGPEREGHRGRGGHAQHVPQPGAMLSEPPAHAYRGSLRKASHQLAR